MLHQKRTGPFNYRIFSFVLIIFALFGPFETVAKDELPIDVQLREEIITLIEETLSTAYSFSSKSHGVPDFEKLDQLFPTWHRGSPGNARQFWVDAGFGTFRVFYRVDYVNIVNNQVAFVEGKKLIRWSDTEDSKQLKQMWPFQLWASLGKRTARDNTYLNATYAIRYKMKLKQVEQGVWRIIEEIIHENPEMANDLRNHCNYEQQLAAWGLKNDCKEGRPFKE